MQIHVERCDFNGSFVAIDSDTYDGAPDSPTRNEQGRGDTFEDAVMDLLERIAARPVSKEAVFPVSIATGETDICECGRTMDDHGLLAECSFFRPRPAHGIPIGNLPSALQMTPHLAGKAFVSRGRVLFAEAAVRDAAYRQVCAADRKRFPVIVRSVAQKVEDKAEPKTAKPARPAVTADLKPGAVIRWVMPSGEMRLWRVEAVQLGATGQQSVVTLQSLDRSPNQFHSTMAVPVELLNAAILEFDTIEVV